MGQHATFSSVRSKLIGKNRAAKAGIEPVGRTDSINGIIGDCNQGTKEYFRTR